MTLNLTVAMPQVIHQCADLCRLDLSTGSTYNGEYKIMLINTFDWSATVCFAGVGRTAGVDVSSWLADLGGSIADDDPFDALVDGLLGADAWLIDAPQEHRRHTFTVGAFVGDQAVLTLVSNFESLTGPRRNIASDRLNVSQLRPGRPTVVVSGQSQYVTRQSRRQLARIVDAAPDIERAYEALGLLNAHVARNTPLVSPACFTTHLLSNGTGGGKPYGPRSRRPGPGGGLLPHAVAPGARAAIDKVIDDHFGQGHVVAPEVHMVRVHQSDQYHAEQLQERPNDANAHNSYGAYLADLKHDREGAIAAFRRALELEPDHVAATGNLANQLWSEPEEADRLYRVALAAQRGSENATYNYTRFLRYRGDIDAARAVLDEGIATNPTSGRLYVLRADLALDEMRSTDALEDYQRAMANNADPASVHAGYPTALQLSGADLSTCITAYHAGIRLNPENGALRVNLAQLLLVVGDDISALAQLDEALRARTARPVGVPG